MKVFRSDQICCWKKISNTPAQWKRKDSHGFERLLCVIRIWVNDPSISVIAMIVPESSAINHRERSSSSEQNYRDVRCFLSCARLSNSRRKTYDYLEEVFIQMLFWRKYIGGREAIELNHVDDCWSFLFRFSSLRMVLESKWNDSLKV